MKNVLVLLMMLVCVYAKKMQVVMFTIKNLVD